MGIWRRTSLHSHFPSCLSRPAATVPPRPEPRFFCNFLFSFPKWYMDSLNGLTLMTRGPPLSPSQASLSPSSVPAQTKFLVIHWGLFDFLKKQNLWTRFCFWFILTWTSICSRGLRELEEELRWGYARPAHEVDLLPTRWWSWSEDFLLEFCL